jgi:hypothetical protein
MYHQIGTKKPYRHLPRPPVCFYMYLIVCAYE